MNGGKRILAFSISIILLSAATAAQVSGQYLEIGYNAGIGAPDGSIGITDSLHNPRKSGADEDTIQT